MMGPMPDKLPAVGATVLLANGDDFNYGIVLEVLDEATGRLRVEQLLDLGGTIKCDKLPGMKWGQWRPSPVQLTPEQIQNRTAAQRRQDAIEASFVKRPDPLTAIEVANAAQELLARPREHSESVMLVSQLQKCLERFRREHGDLPVYTTPWERRTPDAARNRQYFESRGWLALRLSAMADWLTRKEPKPFELKTPEPTPCTGIEHWGYNAEMKIYPVRFLRL